MGIFDISRCISLFTDIWDNQKEKDHETVRIDLAHPVSCFLNNIHHILWDK